MNRTIINMLKTLNDSEKANWKNSITKLAFAYNSTVNKSTGFSPFFLMFGRSSRLPIDNIFGIIHDKFVEDWQHRMKSVVGIAQRNMGKMCKWNKKAYNKKVRGNEINVGD